MVGSRLTAPVCCNRVEMKALLDTRVMVSLIGLGQLKSWKGRGAEVVFQAECSLG